MPILQMTRDEYQQKYGVPAPAPLNNALAPTPSVMGRLAETGQDIMQTAKGFGRVGEEFVGKAADIRSAYDSGEQGLLPTGFQTVGAGLGLATNLLGETFKGLGKVALSQQREEGIKETLSSVMTKKIPFPFTEDVSAVELAQAFKMKYDELDPTSRRNVDAILGIGSYAIDIAAFGGGKKVAEEAGKVAIEGATKVKQGVQETIKPVLRGATEGVEGTMGGVRGALEKSTGFLAKQIRTLNKTLRPVEKSAAVDALTESYLKSFVQGNAAVQKALDKIMVSYRGTVGPTTTEGLVRKFAGEGFLPELKGEVASMRGALDEIARLKGVAKRTIEPLLEPIGQKPALSSIKQEVLNSLKGRIDVDIIKATRQVTSIFSNLESKYGKELTARQLHKLVMEMNKATRAFGKEQFVQDAANAIAQEGRKILYTLAPGAKPINELVQKLFMLEDIARIFHNQKVYAGMVGSSMGRYIGVVGGAGIGFGAAGPGGLVIAGVLANLGSRGIAQVIRQFRFNPRIALAIKEGLTGDKKLLEQIIKQAAPEDAKLIREFLATKSKNFKPGATPTKTMTKQTTLEPLAQEARKYKSAEEFVKAQELLYHGTSKRSAEAIRGAGGFTDKTAGEAIDLIGGKVSPKQPISLTSDMATGKLYVSPRPEGGAGELLTFSSKNLKIADRATAMKFGENIEKLRKAGYDGFRTSSPNDELIETIVFNKEKLQLTSKSQLTDIWNNANKIK